MYIKVDKVEDANFSAKYGYKTMRVFVKDDFFHVLVKEGEALETLDLDKHEESIRRLLRSVNSMDDNDKMNVFGRIDLCPILGTYTIGEIREKYEAWENRPKIGDEVKYGVHTGLVISYTKEKDYVRVLANGENSIFSFPLYGVKKTGRHFDNISIGEIGKYAEK